jgi:PAS domain S-box-containing protein
LVAGVALITAGLILAGLALLEKADRNRRLQVAVRQVEAHANRVSRLEGEVLARREFRLADREITRTLQSLAEIPGRTTNLATLRAACAHYIGNVRRELDLVQNRQFQQATALKAAEVDPAFLQVQAWADNLSEEQNQAAEWTVYTSRIGLIATALFSTITILMYFRRFDRERRRTEQALAERAVAQKNEDRFRTLMENSADVILIATVSGEISYISPSVHSVLGWKNRALIGDNLFDWIHVDDEALTRAALEAAVAQQSASVEFRLGHADGPWLNFASVIRNRIHDPNIQGLLINARDVTQDKKKQEVLDFNATHDVLTKLPNRAVFMQRLGKVIERKKRHPETDAAVLFLDLDDLKVLNDSLGHDSGDLLITEFGERLRACVRSEDTVARSLGPRTQQQEDDFGTIARLGGDEFIVLLEEIREPRDAIRVAERILEAMGEPFVIQGQEVFKGVSIGIAFTSPLTDARTVVAHADIAMYRAKVKGKSCYEVYDNRMHAQIARRMDLEQALRQALEGNQFRVHYQPIVSLATGRTSAVEALVRWERPGVGLVSPNEFIPIAEQSGLIVELGNWVLMEACRQARKWEGAGFEPGLCVSVNVSARQFAYPAFLDQVTEALRASGLDPHHLKLELTEGAAMEDPERAVDLMRHLAKIGVTLSLDDFGTGYSSLSVLRRLPVHTIKIDRSFVSNIHTNSQVAAIVSTICDLARILSMEVIAEGLENLEQLEMLRSVSCDSAQGYLFAVPLPPESVSAILGINLIDRMHASRALAMGSRVGASVRLQPARD